MNIKTLGIQRVCIATATLLLFTTASVVLADDSEEPRLSTSSQGLVSDAPGSRAVEHNELPGLATEGGRAGSTRAANSSGHSASKSDGSTQSSTANIDFWIYSANVALHSDFDRDGYYAGIDLEFDADTVYSVAEVYAVVYLSLDYGPWNEYAETENFTILGASGNDEYVIDTELVSGYPTGDYDILIELYDTYDNSFVASFGPDESSELSFLPLEDLGRDTPPETTIVVNNGGGGSVSLLAILLLLAVVVALRLEENSRNRNS